MVEQSPLPWEISNDLEEELIKCFREHGIEILKTSLEVLVYLFKMNQLELDRLDRINLPADIVTQQRLRLDKMEDFLRKLIAKKGVKI